MKLSAARPFASGRGTAQSKQTAHNGALQEETPESQERVSGTLRATESIRAMSSPVYRSGDIEIEASLGCLKRNGTEQHLRQQSFHVLLYLLERRHRLVTKEELIENFWQETAVTDNALVQCITEVRRALADDPREPRFIKTIPKLGYRFIAAVSEEPAVEAVGTPHSGRADLSVEPNATAKIAGLSVSRPQLIRILLVLLALSGTAFAAWLVFHRSAFQRAEVTLPTLPGRKALAVMYFENDSARPDLNWLSEGLADMFITDLAHFDRLTVLSRQQLHLLLMRSGRKPESPISLDTAMDIARRSRADEVLLGSFITLGEKIVVSVRLFERANGQLRAAEQFVVDQPADILTQVDILSPKLAAHLGAAPQLAGAQTGLADSMTKNLEAYRYYSLGVSKAQAFENAEAITLLRKAIQLDPKFAMAYARIGYAYSVTDFLPEKGKPFLDKALQLSDHLTVKDRLYVGAWHAISQQDYPGAIRTLHRIVDQYPYEAEGFARLARLLYREERPQETIAVVRRGLAADPDYGDLYNVLGVCFLGLARYGEAIEAHERYVQLAPNEPNAHDSLGMSFQQSGNYDRATAEYNAALALDPEFEPAIIHLGDVFAQQGRYKDAISQYQRYIQVTGSDTARAVGYGSIAQVYWRKRDLRLADEASQKELGLAKGAVWNSLLIAMERGDARRAAGLREGLIQNGPYPGRGSRNELRSYDYYLGTLALREKQPDHAIAHFREALRHLPPSSGLDLYEDCLANAFLELNRPDEAINEYQRILHLNPNYPMARYRLAQAHKRKGEFDQARLAYVQFLQIWRNADPDIVEVKEARQELKAQRVPGSP